jgi:hypothetical protein
MKATCCILDLFAISVLLKRILKKFILYFSEFYPIFYEFLNLKQISRIFKWKNEFKKLKNQAR